MTTKVNLLSLLLVVVVILFFHLNIFAQQNWTSLGPGGGGGITTIEIDPTNENIVYVGGDIMGVFKSTNGGQTFQFINNGLTSYEVQAIAINRQNTNTLYVATTSGVYKSTNGGANWTLKRNGFPTTSTISFSEPINALAIDPNDTSIIYAGIGHAVGVQLLNRSGTDFGKSRIYKSTDGANTWTIINTGTNNFDIGSTIFKIAIHPLNSQILYATTNKGFYKSVDGGVNWIKYSSGLPNSQMRGMAIHPSNLDTIYVAVWNDVDVLGWEGGVYQSIDGGQTWTEKNNGLQTLGGAQYVEVIMDPQNPNILYTGNYGYQGVAVYKSTNGGDTWQGITNIANVDTVYRPYPTYWTWSVIAIAPTNDSTLYFGDSNLFKSDNGGTTWQSVHTQSVGSNEWQSSGIETTVLVSVGIDPNNGDIYFGYGDIGLFKSENGGNTFKSLTSNSLQPNEPFDIDFDMANPGYVYVVYNETQNSSVTSPIHKSTDYGNTWTSISIGLPAGGSHSLLIDLSSPTNSRTMYTNRTGNGIYKSIDGGTTWLAANSGLTPSLVGTVLRMDNSNQQILYVTTENGIYKTIDGALNWSLINSSMINTTNLEIDPQNSNIIYISETGGIYKSTDGGNNFTQVLTEGWIKDITIRPDNTNVIYASTYGIPRFDEYKPNGIYKSIDAGNTWNLITGNLPMTAVWPITLDPANLNTVYIGTGGGGGFRLNDINIGTDFTENFLNDNQNTLRVFPNPANSKLIINIIDSQQNLTGFKLVNTLGQTIYYKPIDKTIQKNTYEIDLTKFGKGIYLLITEFDTKLLTNKVIVH